MTEAEHEKIVLTGEKSYHGVNCNANTRKQSVIIERLQEELKIAQDYNEALGKDYKELETENNSLSKRILELQGDKGRLIDEINDWRAKADKAYCEKANAEIKLDEAKELVKNIIRVTWGEGWNYSLDWKVKAEQFLKDGEVEK